MKWLEVVKSEFIKVGVNRLTNALVGLLLLPLLSSFVFPQVFAGLSWQLYLTILTVLSIAFVSVLAAYLSLRRKYVTPFKGWTFDEKRGIWTDGEFFYCPSCKSELKVSPMRASKEGWKCLVKSCDVFYPDPEHKSQPVRMIRRSNWLDGYM